VLWLIKNTYLIITNSHCILLLKRKIFKPARRGGHTHTHTQAPKPKEIQYSSPAQAAGTEKEIGLQARM